MSNGPFSFRPSSVVAGFEILPKDSYTFEVGEPKSFKNISKNPDKAGQEIFGVRYPLKVVSEGPKKNKSISTQLWLHTEGGVKMAKGFLMAVSGYKMNDEKAYDDKYDAADWTLDIDNKSCGSAWHELTGKLVNCDLDVQMDDQAREQQKFGNWRIYG